MQMTGMPACLSWRMPSMPPCSHSTQSIWLVTSGSAPQITTSSEFSSTTGQTVCCSYTSSEPMTCGMITCEAPVE